MGRTYSLYLVEELYKVQRKIANHTGDEPLVLTDWEIRVLAQFPESLPFHEQAGLAVGIIVVSIVLLYAVIEWII